jgi:tetratricopeptide (TPR) repeat protein
MGYEELLVNIPQNMQYFLRVIDCYQQLQQFNSAENIQARLEKYNQESLLVELGYNLQLQKKEDDAKIYYDQAIGRLKKNQMKFGRFIHSKSIIRLCFEILSNCFRFRAQV